jgi:hypothetical protein
LLRDVETIGSCAVSCNESAARAEGKGLYSAVRRLSVTMQLRAGDLLEDFTGMKKPVGAGALVSARNRARTP